MIGHERVWLMVTVLVEVLAQNEVADTMSRRKCASVQPVLPVYDGSVKRRCTGQRCNGNPVRSSIHLPPYLPSISVHVHHDGYVLLTIHWQGAARYQLLRYSYKPSIDTELSDGMWTPIVRH